MRVHGFKHGTHLRTAWRVQVLLLLTMLVACTAIQRSLSFIPGIPDPTKTAIRTISLEAQANANNNSATRLDFLFLLDSGLTDSLPETAPEWFANRELLVSNNSGQMIVQATGLAPGTSGSLSLPSGYRQAEDVILYADYILASGQKWYRLPNVRDVRVMLNRTAVQLEQAANQN